jgi:hypothetical protein
MSTSRTGPASIAQYGPGWVACCDSASRYQRMSATSAAVAFGARRQSSCRRSRFHHGPGTAGEGAPASGGASQKAVMKPLSPSYQSWLPGRP